MLLVLGETPYAEGAGDLRAVSLSETDVRLIDSVANGSRQVVVVLLCGRPLAIPPPTLEKIDALLVAWLPGTEGAGVTDALFGLSAVTGRLSFSWPRDTSQPLRSQRGGGDRSTAKGGEAAGGEAAPGGETAQALFPRGFGLDLVPVPVS